MAIITRKVDYAARILLHLARLPEGTWTTTEEIAQQELIPKRMIRQIIAQLGNVGMVRTRRGSGGGITMAQDATETSLMDIIEALEGPLTLSECIANEHVCPLASRCPMRGALAEAERNLVNDLRAQTLDKLVKVAVSDQLSAIS